MTATVEAVSELMAQVGALMDLMSVVEAEDGAAWILAVDETLAVLAEYDMDSRKLILSAETAVAPEERRAEVYEMLLLFNAQWRDTGGVRMVLEVPGEPVVQVADIAADGLDLVGLQTALGNFIAKAAAWRTLVSEGAGIDGGTKGDGEDEDPQSDLGAVRV